ncbi:hypothetical protein BGW80DRAFT_284001 [Lactifluus volemus]|nr:hypothetical protein BGW80DRAFT_284001 [Lactifluus volemus]
MVWQGVAARARAEESRRREMVGDKGNLGSKTETVSAVGTETDAMGSRFVGLGHDSILCRFLRFYHASREVKLGRSTSRHWTVIADVLGCDSFRCTRLVLTWLSFVPGPRLGPPSGGLAKWVIWMVALSGNLALSGLYVEANRLGQFLMNGPKHLLSCKYPLLLMLSNRLDYIMTEAATHRDYTGCFLEFLWMHSKLCRFQ